MRIAELAWRSQPVVFVHRSHSLGSFRHSSDERNPTDVTWRPAPVKAPGGRQSLDRNLDGPHPGSASSKHGQQRHLQERNDVSTNEQPGDDRAFRYAGPGEVRGTGRRAAASARPCPAARVPDQRLEPQKRSLAHQMAGSDPGFAALDSAVIVPAEPEPDK
jgi:hypothetical protein